MRIRHDAPLLRRRLPRGGKTKPVPLASFDDHLNSVPSIHIRCRMIASFRATVDLGFAQCASLRKPDAPGFERIVGLSVRPRLRHFATS
jgi:hypothetical protein